MKIIADQTTGNSIPGEGTTRAKGKDLEAGPHLMCGQTKSKPDDSAATNEEGREWR